MKHVIKLQMEVEIVCSPEDAETLKRNPYEITGESCFNNKNRRVISVNVLDEEIFDNGIDILNTLNKRYSAKSFNIVEENTNGEIFLL